MNLSDSGTTITVVAVLAVVVGLIGIIIPVLPGLILCWAGVLVWAIFGQAEGGAGWGRWVVLAIATLFALGGTIVKYALPGRNLKRAGVPNLSLFIGGVLGLVGFFVVPVVGLVLGFILGVWVAEQIRLKDGRAAWQSTKAALKATGLSMLIELAAGLAIGVTFVVGLIVL
jgi:uncharacterized protein YqgC (DUF456 family)